MPFISASISRRVFPDAGVVSKIATPVHTATCPLLLYLQAFAGADAGVRASALAVLHELLQCLEACARLPSDARGGTPHWWVHGSSIQLLKEL